MRTRAPFLLSLFAAALITGCDRSPTPAEPTSPSLSEMPALVDIAATSAWTPRAPMPTPRGDGFAIGVVKNSVGTPILYVVGGGDMFNPLRVLETYNPATNTWVRKAPMPVGLWGPDGVGVVNGKMYVVGGYRPGEGEEEPGGQLYEYTPGTNTWRTPSTTCPPHCGSAGGQAGVIGGKIYFTAPDGGGDFSFYRYDPASATLKELKYPPREHWFGGGGVIAGKFYVVSGGYFLNAFLDVYDPGSDTWTTKASLPTPRRGVASVVLNGKLYVIGGDRYGVDLRVVEVYDPASNKWSTGVPMPVAAAYLGAAAVTTSAGVDVAYVMMGRNWLYDPTVPNKPPVAVANGPYTGTVGQPVQFSAKGTYDPEGNWGGTWTFGDGTSYTGTFGNFATQNPTHTYTKAGTFPVTFKVKDEGGLSSTASTTATIVPGPTSFQLTGNLSFGDVQIGTNVRRTFSIGTSGTIAEAWSLAVTGNSANVISIDQSSGTITPPNNRATINVIFTPRTTAQYSGKFVVTQVRNGAQSAATWSGQGTQAPVARAVLSTDAVLDFGTVPAGTIVTKQLTVRNTGSAPLTVDRVQTTITCTVSGGYPTNIPPGSSGVITYKCPIPAGVMTGESIITSNASNSLVTVQLTGRGQ